MGGATHRFFTLLPAATLPLLFARRHSSLHPFFRRRHAHLIALCPLSPAAAAQPTRRLFHSRAAASLDDHGSLPLPPPEWTRLLDALSAAGYFDRAEAVELAGPPEFTRAAGACLEFARERAGLVRLLSRRDVEIVVRNGTPFLFKDAISTNVLEMDKVSTVDLMRLILSYVSNFIFPSESNNVYNRDLIESSARKLLLEMAKLCYVVPDSNSFDRERNDFAYRNGEPVRPFGQKIEMKRGDWICTRCNFMNFARNVKCLECEEARPKSQLTGGEWECPQCDFFNYGKNSACLRCDCKRPGQISVGSGENVEGNLVKADIDSRLAENEEKAQRWFSKISHMDSTSDISSVADEDFPEIMPLRKGVNRFVVSKRKTPTERRLANSEFQTSSAGGGNPNYVPFVPLPPDMFAKKPENIPTETSDKTREIAEKPPSQVESSAEREQIEKSDRWFKKVAELHNVTDLAGAISDDDFPEIMPMRKGENRFVVGKKKDRSLVSPAYKRQMAMEQTTDTKFVPFVPFPPDYFAKKNDKPQAGEADRTTQEQLLQSENSSVSPSSSSKSPMANLSVNTTSNSIEPTPGTLPQDFTNPRNDSFGGTRISGKDFPLGSSFSPPQDQNVRENRISYSSRNDTSGTSRISGKDSLAGTLNPSRSSLQPPQDQNIGENRGLYSNPNNSLGTSRISGRDSPTGSSLQPPQDQNVGEYPARKSLEGSAVKEADPLDMSEEAKAERWFRRVAQIKDISELSQIPDEDFPSIMPMRKGVNRFVVSKRKTPLERRLTSPQYRRNIPVVSSDPGKAEDGDG